MTRGSMPTTSGGERAPSLDIVMSGENSRPLSIASDGTTMWVPDGRECKLFVYPLPGAE